MAKDPAVLFYTSDFLTGCALMSMAQRGKYITLLCLQHQQGHLSEEDMLEVCGSHDPKIWKKFKQDEDGLYYNERMDEECRKRKEYAISRSENGKKGGRPKKHTESECEAYENHMLSICKPYEKHIENEIENKFSISTPNKEERVSNERSELDTSSYKDKETDSNKRFKVPTVDEVRAYCSERQNDVDAEHFVSYYESNGWMVGKNRMKDWKAAVRTWERNGFSNTSVTSDNAVKGATFGKLSFDPDEAERIAIERSRRRMREIIETEGGG